MNAMRASAALCMIGGHQVEQHSAQSVKWGAYLSQQISIIAGQPVGFNGRAWSTALCTQGYSTNCA